ncbi:unnamed protein product [Meloidogyne enterolobii]|uniref:Uncharacterized protein n=1 Tax=Meloidogyne enterolobii TaxID=390850 RepID=A0ACB1ARU8_MELEN
MSLIWKYFSLPGRVAFCKSCSFSKNYPPRAPTTFLISHLRGSHPELYDDFLAKRKAKMPQQQTLKRFKLLIILFQIKYLEHLRNQQQQHLRFLKKEELEDEIEEITAKDRELTLKKTKELEKKLKELRAKKEKQGETSIVEENNEEEEKLKNELEEIKIKNSLKAQFREHDGKFSTKKEAKDELAMSAKEKEIYQNEKLKEVNMTEEEKLKRKEESEKVRKLKEEVKDEEKNFVEKNSELLKLKNLQNMDKDKFGLLSVFNYMVMIKEFKKDECYEETVKEFEFERQLGVLEYEYGKNIFNK